jgi:hypothetical protein
MGKIQLYLNAVFGRGTGERSDAVTQSIKMTANQTWSITSTFSLIMVNLVLYLTSIEQTDPNRPPRPDQHHR